MVCVNRFLRRNCPEVQERRFESAALHLRAVSAARVGERCGASGCLPGLRPGDRIQNALLEATLVEEVLPVADRVARRQGDPTEFELLTAVVFRWFAEEQPDVALVEVGLGGRLDATHAWDGGVAAITNVALDHMEELGPTVGTYSLPTHPDAKHTDDMVDLDKLTLVHADIALSGEHRNELVARFDTEVAPAPKE